MTSKPSSAARMPPAVPRHDRGVGRHAAVHDFVPADQPPPVAGEKFLDPGVEVALKFVFGAVAGVGFQPRPADQRLAFGTLPPPCARRFVAPDVDVLRGEESDHLFEDLFHEIEDRGIARAEDVAAHARLRGDDVRPARASEFGVGGERRRHVARHVDLRNDLDIPACGILDDVADLPFGVVAAEGARLARERRVAAESPGFRQTGIGVDLDPPPLIVGQVPVEDVEVVQRCQIDDPLHLFDGIERAPHVEHHAPVAQIRFVGDADRREKHFGCFCGAHRLAERLDAVEHAGVGLPADGDAVLGNLYFVRFAAFARRVGPQDDCPAVVAKAVRTGDFGGRADDRFDISGEKLRIGAHAVAVAGAYDPGAGVQFEIAAVAGRDFAGARHDPVIGGRFAALAAGRERDAGQQQVE